MPADVLSPHVNDGKISDRQGEQTILLLNFIPLLSSFSDVCPFDVKNKHLAILTLRHPHASRCLIASLSAIHDLEFR